MHSNAADLLFLLRLMLGLPSLFLPLAFAIKSKDTWAIIGVVILLAFGLVALAGAGPLGYADQILAIILWFASFALALVAYYSPRNAKPV